ncbi:MAG: hypothetical protein GX575_17670 [Candidatus Anammoximicrobium sp.]|nr:hypothetical protein [Candidatus Anammoximicrobium sp.]
MKPPQAAVDINRREVLRSRAGTVVWGCCACLLLAGSCAGAETLARQPSAPPDSGIQVGSVRPSEDWASAMAGVPSDPAQWPSAMPPGAAPQQKPDPTGLVLTPIAARFPLECDWFLQDWAPRSPADWWLASDRRAASLTLFERAVRELPDDRAAAFRQTLRSAGETTAESVLRLYQQVGHERRQQRLAALFARGPRIVFTKFRDEGQGYAPRPAVSDGRGGGFAPGGALCLLEFDGSQLHTRTLVDSPQGMIRDADVSFDGQRILFAWRKDARDDFHLYQYEVADGQIRQLTAGKGFADYQGKYLPDGGIVFSSTRCVQTSDCIDIDVSNLYRCNADGSGIRRLGFDQVSTCFPSVLNDGRILYTRWEYQDRGQIFPQPLFAMNPDGTAQVGYYGNNSWFPTAIHHARGVPGTQKVLAILTGHHTPQMGELALIDTSLGREEATGILCMAPPRRPAPVRVDHYGQQADRFQYPYPLDETEYLAGLWPRHVPRLGVYYVRQDGGRELLAADPRLPCTQPVPLAARQRPPALPSRVDDQQRTGLVHLQDVYYGPGLAGVRRGAIKWLRVVALDYRAAAIGMGQTNGPAGGVWNVRTPVAINGTWDVKRVLGEVPVAADGSACFEVPARTPVYFQALDERGFMVQSMRSWTVLQPGETVSCVGCHKGKNEAPRLATVPGGRTGRTAEIRLPPAESVPGFSFIRDVQPILDRHCISCHRGRRYAGPEDDVKPTVALAKGEPSWSLLGRVETETTTGRQWSDAYVGLIRAHRSHSIRVGQTIVLMAWPGPLVNWISPQSVPEQLPSYSAGAARSGLIDLLQKGHEEVSLDDALKALAPCRHS